ncbi:MAG: GntR family transcriptional regulator [Pseudorhodoplanes sp.]|nr:GntR family transcriptional regulator [Pseudorhodoplanes sp.]
MSRPKIDTSDTKDQPRPARRVSVRRPAAPPEAVARDDERFSRTGWLAGVLRARILDGTYRPGERIREIQLRNEFGFSNGPIREALQAIVADGLAERAPWHGVRVKSLSEEELIELFQVRLALLEYAAELAARRVSEKTIASARSLKRDLDLGFEQIERSGGHLSFNGALSRWLLAAAGNNALRGTWEKTMHQTLIYVNASLKRSHGRKSRLLCNKLIDSICAGDVPTARQAARELTAQTLVDLGIRGQL